MNTHDPDDPSPRRLKLLMLAYLLMYPLPWLNHPPSTTGVAASAAGIAMFLVLYTRGYGLHSWRRLPFALATLALGFALHSFGGVWSVFAVYAATMAGFGRPARVGITGVIVILACVTAFGLTWRLSPWDWGPGVFFGAIVGFGAVFIATINERNRQLAAAREESRHLAVLAERERIARDLHDVLGHTLTLVAVKADLAGRLLDRNPEAARREIGEIHASARAALADVRAAVSGMRSTTLAAELSEARRALESAGIAVACETSAEPLPPLIETALAYVIREATTNVIRHSGARRCRITLAREGGDAALEVSDDGNGGCVVEGHGVTGMRQRLTSIRGALELRGDSGHARARKGAPRRRRRLIRVVVAEDQGMVLGALAALLALEEDIEVVGRAADGLEAWALITRLAPDVLVSDIEMPQLTGLDLAQRIRDARLACRVLIVTTFGRPGYLRRALDAGVCGYILKDQPSDQLAAAVRKVRQGQRVVAPELAAVAWAAPSPLSERERAVLRLAEEGRSNKEIADSLDLSPGTVRNYLYEAAQKLGAANRVEAARIARANGWM